MLNKENLKKLPWKSYDNPNAWLEITNHCQLKCPGCYRGLHKKNIKRFHEELIELKNQVDFFIKTRNIQTVSLSGGEPLLYPYLDDLIRYIISKKLKIKIYTNALLLDEKRLIELKILGATEIVIHIDKNQKRKKIITEKELNYERERYCNLFRKIQGVNLGFIMPISKDNIDEIEDVLMFFKNNSDIINLIVFTCYNSSINDEKKDKHIDLELISEKITEVYKIPPSNYLGKINSDKISWLFFFPIFYKKKVIGYINKNIYLYLQKRYHQKKGKYFITIKGNKINLFGLFYLLGFFKFIKISFLSIIEGIYPRSQVLLIIDSPNKIKSGWDLCESCPDPVLHKNKLVPSCLLERVKKGEDISIK